MEDAEDMLLPHEPDSRDTVSNLLNISDGLAGVTAFGSTSSHHQRSCHCSARAA
jgi:hypothetical protein